MLEWEYIERRMRMRTEEEIKAQRDVALMLTESEDGVGYWCGWYYAMNWMLGDEI